ncbi:LysR family transcriptional regulator [Lachnospiraceae bacterium ZAX-1]
MDFRQLEVFCAVVEWHSFSEAAHHLYLTQPTISTHIHTLEKELNIQLLQRTTKNIALTKEGKQFYEYAKSLLRLRDKALREFNHTNQDVIQLGVSSIPSAYLIPEILSAYHNHFPTVSFDLVQSDSQGIINRIVSGSLDIGIIGTKFSDDSCCYDVLCSDELVLATPATPYYLSLRNEQAPLTRFLEEPYLMREDGSGTRKEADLFLESFGFSSSSLHIIAYMNDLEAIKQSIIYGLGISILSAKVTKDLKVAKRILEFPLAKPGIYRNYYIAYRKSRIQTKQIWNFIQFVRNFYHE